MRISFVTDTWLPEINGVTTVLATMHRGLQRRGHTVQVVAPRYGHDTDDPPDIVRRPSIVMPGYAYSRLALPFDRGTGRALRAFRPDIVHVVTEGPLAPPAAGLRFQRRFLSSPHFTPISPATPPGTWVAGPLRRCARTCAAFTALPRSRRRPVKRRGASWPSWACPGPWCGGEVWTACCFRRSGALGREGRPWAPRTAWSCCT